MLAHHAPAFRKAEQEVAENARSGEQKARHGQPGKVLACDKHLSARRGEEVVVKGPVLDLSAEQSREDPDTAEEDDHPQHEGLEEDGIDQARLPEPLSFQTERKRRAGGKEHNRRSGQQVDRDGSLAQEAPSQLEPEDGGDLPPPHPRGDRRTPGRPHAVIHAVSPPEPTRYW